jgi:hypothetical protein
VLRQPCPDCGIDVSSFAREQISGMLTANAAAWPRALGEPDAERRPRPDKWSPLEYGCHVRDVFRLYDHRLQLMLTEDDPLFPNWDQDETAVADKYGEQDPRTVAAELTAAGAALADRFATVSGETWQRPGRRSDGAAFTVETFGRYLVHDPVHHLYDVTGVRYAAA